MKPERLDKILSSQNIGTRREVGKAIRAGRVSVNGQTVLRPEAKADAEGDAVCLDGTPLEVKNRLVLMMNKPSGVLSASRDPKAETVVDLLPKRWQRRGIFPAGRLDRDTEGLLILTDDGILAHRMLAPKSHVEKWYEARLMSPVTEQDAAAFRAGLDLGEMVCLPAALSALPCADGSAALVALHEGKFHQVKRMFRARGNCVLALRRVRIGGLPLDPDLGPGEARELSEGEIRKIFAGKQSEK